MPDEPAMLTKFAAYAKRAGEVQKHCCCRRWHPRECLEARYPRPFGDDLSTAVDDFYEECECRCHEDLAALEEEIWPEDDGAEKSI